MSLLSSSPTPTGLSPCYSLTHVCLANNCKGHNMDNAWSWNNRHMQWWCNDIGMFGTDGGVEWPREPHWADKQCILVECRVCFILVVDSELFEKSWREETKKKASTVCWQMCMTCVTDMWLPNQQKTHLSKRVEEILIGKPYQQILACDVWGLSIGTGSTTKPSLKILVQSLLCVLVVSWEGSCRHRTSFYCSNGVLAFLNRKGNGVKYLMVLVFYCR